MQHFADYLRASIAGLGSIGGGLGLFFIAFLDSSFLTLPEINDILIIYFCMRFKEHAFYYAIMAALGSAAGSTVLYWLGKSKGYRFLKRRYSEDRLNSALGFFQRYGMFALIGPAVLPPPFPYKIFVLSAGVFGISSGRFLTAVLLGRGFRYAFEAWIAVRYGEQAMAYLQQNYMQVAVIVLALILGSVATYLLVSFLKRKQRASSTEAPEVNL
jgi:membrane protein YqaA with SNARE-associated domain